MEHFEFGELSLEAKLKAIYDCIRFLQADKVIEPKVTAKIRREFDANFKKWWVCKDGARKVSAEINDFLNRNLIEPSDQRFRTMHYMSKGICSLNDKDKEHQQLGNAVQWWTFHTFFTEVCQTRLDHSQVYLSMMFNDQTEQDAFVKNKDLQYYAKKTVEVVGTLKVTSPSKYNEIMNMMKRVNPAMYNTLSKR